MTPDDPDRVAATLAGEIVAARVGAAAGRPNVAEGRDAAGYYRIILDETRRALGLDAIVDPPEESPST
jgi:hypothetical protein